MLRLVDPSSAPPPVASSAPLTVDPYAHALAVAYQLSPDFSDDERRLERMLVEYCAVRSIDHEWLLSHVGRELRPC